MTIEELRSIVSSGNVPAGIDRKNLQEYLSDEDFESIFKMTKAAFGALAGWKRNGMKQKAGIF